MDKAHSSKIPIKAKRTESIEKLSSDDSDTEGYDLYMGIWELSVSLGNFNHNVDESVKFITENSSTPNDSFELVLLNDFRVKFEQLQIGVDSEEKTLHETRSDLFMRLYKELVDLEQEPLRCEFLNLCYELFDSVHPKLEDRNKSYAYRVELIDQLHAQVQNILHRLNGTADVYGRSSDFLINICLGLKTYQNEASDELNRENTCPVKEIVSEKIIEKRKLESSRIEGYRFIQYCINMTTYFSKGIRIESEVPQNTERTIIPRPEDLVAKDIASIKCLQNYTSIASEEIPLLDLSNLSEPDYNATDEYVPIKGQENFHFKNSISSPKDNFNKIAISDLGILPQDNNTKDPPVIGNYTDVVSKDNDRVIVPKLGSSTESFHENGLDDFNSQGRRNGHVASILIASVSEKPKEYKHFFKKDVFTDGKEFKDAVSLNVPKNDTVSTNCLDENDSSDRTKSKKICKLIIKEAVSPNPLEIKTCIPKKDDFDKEVILDGKKVKDVEDLNVSGNDTFSTNGLDKNVTADEMESKDIGTLIIEKADPPNDFKNKTFSDDYIEVLDDEPAARITSNCEPTDDKPDASKWSTLCSHIPLKKTIKRSLSYDFSDFHLEGGTSNGHHKVHGSLDKMKHFYEDYKNKLDSITEIEDKMDSKMDLCEDIYENVRSPKNDTRSDQVGFSDGVLSKLRQTVSDIKLNVLKEVDRSLELTLQNGISGVLSRKPSLEQAGNASKMFGRNSKFTDGLRLKSPKKISSKLIPEHQKKKDDGKLLSPRISPSQKLNRCIEIAEKDHTAECRINREIKCKDVVIGDCPKTVECNCFETEDPKATSCSLYTDIREECYSVVDDWFFEPAEKSHTFFAEEDDKEMLPPKSSQISKIDEPLTAFSYANCSIEVNNNSPDVLKPSSDILLIDFSDDRCLVKNDIGSNLTSENSVEQFFEFSAEEEGQQMTLLKYSNITEIDKSLTEFSQNNYCTVACVNNSEDIKTPLHYLRADTSVSYITEEKLSELSAEEDGQKKLSIEPKQSTKRDRSLTQFSYNHCSTEACINNPDNVKSTHNLPIDISDDCYLTSEESNAFIDEQDDQHMLFPILKESSQTDSEVTQPIFNVVDRSLTQLSRKNYQSEESINNIRNSKNLDLDLEDLKTSSNTVCIDISEEYLNLNLKQDRGQEHESVDEQDNQEMLSPILSQIKKTVSDVKLNVLKEVDKSLSELTLKCVSTHLQRNQTKANFKNKSNSVELTEETSILFDISEESDVRRSHKREVHTSLSESTLRSTSEVLPRNCSYEEFRSMSPSSELSFNSRESNSIIDLCKKCDINVNYSKPLDKYIADGLSIQKRHISEMANNDGSGDLNIYSKTIEFQNWNKMFSEWHHQRHIIAAPRAIIKIFKSNSAYECSSDDPNAPDFYEQLDQFFEITGEKKCSPAFHIDLSSIESRIIEKLKQARKVVSRKISYSDWVALVGKFNLRQLLSREERDTYESLRWQLRDTGDEDISAKSRFTDALHGMMGYGSPHLKVSSVTGRLHLRSPQHQDSLSESYLLLIIGHLGYFYKELANHLDVLGQRGQTAAALRKCLQSYLLDFKLFYKRQKKYPCSLLSLYRNTREHQVKFQWLLAVMQNIQNEKSIIVSLYEQSRRRCGYQRSLLLMWLKVASQPMIFRLQQWLLGGHLNSFDCDEFPIERSITSDHSEFWLKRYRITDHFSGLFGPQLSETLISVGKTMAYSQKYLGIEVESCLKSKELREMLLDKFDHFYEYADQEPLYNFLCNLHLEISSKVLKCLREIKYNPKYLFSQLYKYIMLADVEFIREFINHFEEFLEKPESSFNIQLFNEIKDNMSRKSISDIYIDKGFTEGTRCWSCLVLRWKFPKYWTALLGKDAEAYEPISMAIWRFHYVDYVLLERILQQQEQIRSRFDFEYLEGLEETHNCFARLIKNCLELMNVLRHYFFKDLLEPTFAKLLLACNQANTIEDILEANRIYLKSIKRGCLQTKRLRKSNQYLERLYNFILKLDDTLQKFLKSCETLKDYVLNIHLHNAHSLVSTSYRDRMLTFRLTCQNCSYVIIELRDQFISGMISFLLSLHLANEDPLRLLALSLDPKNYYMRKDKRLSQVQLFEFKRKTRKSS
ncbi:uncharacterized protein LOC119548435 [Drosophila subpulchrella]|uniref:uncharacterized protein LOC119548435 n=1 Tax=Drosophila subpulchrella TaxID=1486046 RepID=UPI0018A1AB43|nr:uncharacterized protein LOC119548435 [Drosophila subpulchrella]